MSAKCPICNRPREDKFKPFCSKRCADVDLSRWLKGNYAIPAAETDDSADGMDDAPGAPQDTGGKQ